MLAQGLDYLRDTDLRGQIPRLPGLLVIIQGEQDRIVPPAQARFLHQQAPGSRLYLLKGAGHIPFLTQAAAFNAILRELLGIGSSPQKVLPKTENRKPETNF
jgi:pimeloyl-ACP methyl ester carboxylesterase